jgi:hypothetical protein
MLMRNKEVLLSVGMFCLAAAILLKRFAGGFPAAAFIEGVLIGVSVVCNIVYLRRRSKENVKREGS